ncbi:MAG: 3'-5' exoribonuclease YhaM family protein [Bacillota bacterium]
MVTQENLNTAEKLDYIMSLAFSVKDQFIKRLFVDLFSDYDWTQKFCHAPAAKLYHQAYEGGLLDHSLNVAVSANFIAESYPSLDRDLLIAGAILHDSGKAEELEYGQDAIAYTDAGRLLGHIVLGILFLEKKMSKIKDFPETLRLKLLHMIASHHGQYEWQSPKRPKFLEAQVLHHIDMIDAAVDIFGKALEERKDKESSWSDYIKGINRRVFCK